MQIKKNRFLVSAKVEWVWMVAPTSLANCFCFLCCFLAILLKHILLLAEMDKLKFEERVGEIGGDG